MLDVAVRVVGAVRSALPVALHLGEEAVLVLLRALLHLVTLRRHPVGELVDIPAVVRLGDIVIPVGLHQVLQVLAVRGGREGDVVVREPALQLGLVPFVVRRTA